MVSSPSSQQFKFVKKNIESHKYLSIPTKEIWKEQFFSASPPTLFVGSKLKYPNVNVGILTPPEGVTDAWKYDAQSFWAQQNFSIRDIIKLRGSLINSRFQTTTKSHAQFMNKKFLDIAQEIGIAKNQVDVEIHLKKSVKVLIEPDTITLPTGPRAQLRNARITSNVKTDPHVDKAVSDTDWKASEALSYLLDHHIHEHTLSQLLSIGMIGHKKNRRLVPTRWSITATDDMLGKHLLHSIREYPIINDYELYTGNYLGNYYTVILFPEIWSYELFELYLPGSAWNQTHQPTAATDDEEFYGRKTYASNTAGGYYSARLPLIQMLCNRRRQASALVIRCETPEYWAGLGVWVVREAMKKTMSAQPRSFATKEEALKEAAHHITQALRFDISPIFQRSQLLKKIREQTKLFQFT